MSKPLSIDYYSDVLCIWAWVAQSKIAQVSQQFGQNIQINNHFIDLFGDTKKKMSRQWAGRGCYQGFATHVQTVADDHQLTVHPKLWQEDCRPTTSANAHLVIKAVEIACNKDIAQQVAFNIRQAFFSDGQDIGQLSVLFDILTEQGIDKDAIIALLMDGEALASLLTDYQTAKQLALQGSPSFIIDNGRQILYGDISVEVLMANIKAHLIKK